MGSLHVYHHIWSWHIHPISTPFWPIELLCLVFLRFSRLHLHGSRHPDTIFSLPDSRFTHALEWSRSQGIQDKFFNTHPLFILFIYLSTFSPSKKDPSHLFQSHPPLLVWATIPDLGSYYFFFVTPISSSFSFDTVQYLIRWFLYILRFSPLWFMRVHDIILQIVPARPHSILVVLVLVLILILYLWILYWSISGIDLWNTIPRVILFDHSYSTEFHVSVDLPSPSPASQVLSGQISCPIERSVFVLPTKNHEIERAFM